MAVPIVVRSFGAEVRRRRESMGLTLPEFAARCGLTPNYIGGVEMGLRDPSLSTCMKLAKGFGVPAGELVGGVHGLSAAAMEFSRLLDASPREVWDALEQILRASVRRAR